ncbi:EsaB/YukD family protein [Nocardioides yefusunii]|uniref:EsaB/YukD family protein n=1 Tax=Nocardioides yefusunii TaxID=2500546 RepID=A0ABW1QYD2_9ACTN|nr:EsaB/YukD family protein [Nocardioides yefusunii]
MALLAGHLRLDLAVPAHLPLLEVIPDLVALARRAGADVTGDLGGDVGAEMGADVTLVEVGGQRLRPDATLAEQDVRDGALLVLDAAHAPIPLTLHHDLVGAVADVVERRHVQVDDRVRRTAARAATTALGLVLALVLVAGAGGGGGVLGALAALTVAVVAAVLLRRREEPTGGGKEAGDTAVALVLHLVFAPVAGLLWGWTWALRAGGDPVVAGWCGAAVGGALSVLVLSWAEAGRREWALVPAVVLVVSGSAAAAGRLEVGGVSLGWADALSAVVVLCVLAVAPLVSALVQAVAVRGAPEDPRPVQMAELSVRIDSAVRCVLALDVAVMLLIACVTPIWMTRGAVGVGVWGSVVLLLWARTRGERLQVRHRWGLVGVGVLVLWGVVQWCAVGATGLTTTAMTVVAGLALAGSWLATVWSSGWSRRPVAIGERLLRLALPSLWLLSSGLLPRWPR